MGSHGCYCARVLENKKTKGQQKGPGEESGSEGYREAKTMGEAASRAANTNDPRDQVPAWAGAPMRVDPYQLPLRVAPPSCNGTSYTIGRQGGFDGTAGPGV